MQRVNFSRLKHIGRSPAHYRYEVDHGAERAKLARFGVLDEDDTEARQRGRVVAMAAFEPQVFKEQVVVFPGKVRRGSSWEEFLDRHPDAEIVTEKLYEHARKMGKIIREHEQAAPLLHGGIAEVTCIWEHVRKAVEGVGGYRFPCKGRLDYVSNAISDLKHVTTAEMRDFGNAVMRYKWHAQGAFYKDGVFASTGRDLPYFIIALESEPPYVLQVYELADEELQIGRDTYRAWLDRLDECRRTKRYPGYAEAPMKLQLPRYAYPNDDF